MKIITSVTFAIVGTTLLATSFPAIQAHANDQTIESNTVVESFGWQ